MDKESIELWNVQKACFHLCVASAYISDRTIFLQTHARTHHARTKN